MAVVMFNEDFIRLLVEVLSTADGGCASCASSLAQELDKRLPGYGWERHMAAYLKQIDVWMDGDGADERPGYDLISAEPPVVASL